MTTFIKALKKSVPAGWIFSPKSYSQEGEDMVYRSFFETRKNYKGFYVDVGAHHPTRFSNTFYFYRKGWHGINIEPTPGAGRLFDIYRKRDININAGISSQAGSLPFYCFDDEPALNSFSKTEAEHTNANTRYKITRVINIAAMTLAGVLEKHLPDGQAIDFLNIDAEGFEMEVLISNDWSRYTPLFIIIEIKMAIENITGSAVYNYLTERNYVLVAKTMRTSFFKYNG